MKKRQPTMKEMNAEQMCADLALRMALHCVRNTVIEEYHCRGSISDPEMKVFNKEVVKKLYTFLQIIMNPMYSRERELVLRSEEDSPAIYYKPESWDAPEFDESILKGIALKWDDHSSLSALNKKQRSYR